MTDFHTHILPMMDDGSQSVGESVAMLARLQAQGVTTVVASPHYDSAREAPEAFAARRARALAMLAATRNAETPIILPGAEVKFFIGLSQAPDLRPLCLEGTDSLLLEMPFCPWTSPVVNEVYKLITVRALTPVLAHVERYIADRYNLDVLRDLISFGAVAQSNAEFFLSRRTRARAFSMLRKGYIHAFGSDCHNLEDRPPNMGALLSLICKKLGISQFHALQTSAEVAILGQRLKTN
ncbi:MAG: capsular polysaccharide biosynthesis protein [Oscillospiraceae bacterium]|nr:capsular polysaccharide biosynthesis protein [Oscillospiraceae bacterium]